jgi:hypothetical protein
MSLKDRKNFVKKRIYELYNKYKNTNYNILKPIKFRLEHNIRYNEEINLDNFSKILPKKVVYNFTFVEN